MPIGKSLDVSGMRCRGCEQALRAELLGVDGIIEAEPDHRRSRVGVVFDPARISEEEIGERIRAVGSEVRPRDAETAPGMPDPGVPDRVPEGLVARFGPEARRPVRSRRTLPHTAGAPSDRGRRPSGLRRLLGGTLAAAAITVCCALPFVIALWAGALAAAGGVIARFWPLVVAGVAVATWAGVGLARWVRKRKGAVGRGEEQPREQGMMLSSDSGGQEEDA